MFCENCGMQLVETAATKAENLEPFCGQCDPAAGSSAGSVVRVKSRVVFVLLGLIFGVLGLHNFYAGYKEIAITQLLITVLLFWIPVVGDIAFYGVWIWAMFQVVTVVKDAGGNLMS